MSAPIPPRQSSLTIVHFVVETPMVYSLEDAAQIAGVHPDRLRYYCRLGLLGVALPRDASDPLLDDDQIYELRRFEYFRLRHGVKRKTLRLLCALWNEVESLRRELRGLRER